MGVVAGFLVQHALKKLLGFGETPWYLGYSALTDFFPKMKLKPNPYCQDPYCIQWQKMYAETVRDQPPPPLAQPEEKIVHSDNSWGITLVDESQEVEEVKEEGLVEGVQRAYQRPDEYRDDEEDIEEVDTTSESLDDLMNRMKAI
jgi:ubiquitin-like modifier-activating enzyme 5